MITAHGALLDSYTRWPMNRYSHVLDRVLEEFLNFLENEKGNDLVFERALDEVRANLYAGTFEFSEEVITLVINFHESLYNAIWLRVSDESVEYRTCVLRGNNSQ